MFDSLLPALKWAAFGNAIFMLIWMGYRMMLRHTFAWLLLDAAIVVVSIVVAHRYHEEGV